MNFFQTALVLSEDNISGPTLVIKNFLTDGLCLCFLLSNY